MRTGESNTVGSVTLHGVRLAQVELEAVSWAAPGRIPFGKVTLIEGHPGVGKSHLTIDILSRCSRGQGQFGATHQTKPAYSILLTAEDGLGDTVRPRVIAAGGDANLIWAITHATREGSEEQELVTLPDHVDELHGAIADLNAKIVIVDPLTAYLGGQINSFKDHDVRRALAPLARLAEQTGCAVVVVRHLTKAASGNAITAGGGSIGIIGAARSALLVSVDPENPGQVIVAAVKSNLCSKPPSLKFALITTPNGYARIEWRGESEHSADALIAAGREAGEEKGQLKEAIDLLQHELRNGPVAKKQLVKLADDEKISRATLERAATKLGLTRDKDKAFQGVTMWALPYTRTREDIGARNGANSLSDNGSPISSNHVSRKADPDYLTHDEEIAYLASQKTPASISSSRPNSSSSEDIVRSLDKSSSQREIALDKPSISSRNVYSREKASSGGSDT